MPFSRRDGPLVRHVPHDSLSNERSLSMTSYPAATWCLLPATVHTRACVCVRARLAPSSTKGANDGHPTSLALLSFAAASAIEFRLVFGSSSPVRSRDDTEE